MGGTDSGKKSVKKQDAVGVKHHAIAAVSDRKTGRTDSLQQCYKACQSFSVLGMVPMAMMFHNSALPMLTPLICCKEITAGSTPAIGSSSLHTNFESADPWYLRLHYVALPDLPDSGRSAGQNDITRFKGENACNMGNDLGQAMNHIR